LDGFLADIKANRMKEVIVYGVVAVSSLILLGYTVHMFIGGIVSERTETITMLIAMLIGAIAIGFLVWDVIRRRRGLSP
jgi:hypothetical protein